MQSHAVILFALLMVSSAASQFSASYGRLTFEDDMDNLPYRLLLPKDYDETKAYPLLIVLHGSGERGNDNEAQLVHGSVLFLKEEVREKYPMIVVFPQCSANSSWAKVSVKGIWGNRSFTFYEDAEPTDDMQLLEGLIKQLKKDYTIDSDRMYVGGLSMGGMGTFELVRRNPRMFAAAFPICGGANPKIAKQLHHVAWWVFHGDADRVVPSKYSSEMVAALKAVGADVKFNLYEGVAHKSWENAFAEPELLAWLFSKTK